MTAWIWVLVPLVAIVGGLIIEYQKNKMKMMDRSRHNEQEVDDLRKLVSSLRERIENLEAIAASEPEEFSSGTAKGVEEINVKTERSMKEENQQQVSNIARKQKSS